LREVRPAEDVLEPQHVVHLCNESCESLGPGFSGCHGRNNEFLHNINMIY
jgi:hypothetical protein